MLQPFSILPQPLCTAVGPFVSLTTMVIIITRDYYRVTAHPSLSQNATSPVFQLGSGAAGSVRGSRRLFSTSVAPAPVYTVGEVNQPNHLDNCRFTSPITPRLAFNPSHHC